MKKQLTLNKNNASIFERMNEIYIKEWDIDVKVARNTLRKIYYSECDKRMSIEDHRLVLHNLVCSEIEAYGVTNSAKLWAKTLLDYLNSEPEYVKNNTGEYGKAINNYLYTHKGELSDDEMLLAYQTYYDIFKNCKYEDNAKNYIEKLISKFNLNIVKGNFNEAFNSLKGLLIHNDNGDCKVAFNYCLEELKEVDVDLYNQMLSLSKVNIIKIS